MLGRLFNVVFSAVHVNASVASRFQSDSSADDLTDRLRHPLRWALKHPFQALRRTIVRLA